MYVKCSACDGAKRVGPLQVNCSRCVGTGVEPFIDTTAPPAPPPPDTACFYCHGTKQREVYSVKLGRIITIYCFKCVKPDDKTWPPQWWHHLTSTALPDEIVPPVNHQKLDEYLD